MFKVKFKRKKNHIPNLVKRVEDLCKQEVKVGWFKELGVHKSDSPYENRNPLTYTQLASVLDWGNRYTGMRGFHYTDLMVAANPLKDNKDINKTLRKYFSNIKNSKPRITANNVMQFIGGEYVQNYRNILGNKSSLRALKPSTIEYKSKIGAPDPTSPLVAFGGLRDNVSYKINGVIVTP